MTDTQAQDSSEHNDSLSLTAKMQQQLANCEQKLATAREAERRFHLFADNVKDYALITYDQENRITGWNRGAERILGYNETSILGQPGSILFTPEDRARGDDRREAALARAEGRAENERWHLRQDGSRFWGSGVLTILSDEVGQFQGYIKVMRDLTARREAEQRLRESEERFRLFVENVIDYALIPVDEEGNVSGWNRGAERTFGYTQEEILGQPVNLFFTPEDNSVLESERDLGLALTDGRAEYERYMVRKDGTRFWASWVTTPMRDAEGHLRGFAKVLRDETRRKQVQDERERLAQFERELLASQVLSKEQELDRTKEELRALAASLLTAQEEERRRIARELHDDFQQRLALLEVSVSRLRQSLPADPSQIRMELNRLEGELSTVSQELRRLSHRLHPAILEDLGLRIALVRLAEDFQSHRAQPVRVEARNVPEEISLRVSTALYRIAQEALRNVAKHASTAAVTITLTAEDDSLQLIVQDTGPGFTPQEMRFRGGLGLIGMQERAMLAGGTFHVASSPGHGVIITVRIPLSLSLSLR